MRRNPPAGRTEPSANERPGLAAALDDNLASIRAVFEDCCDIVYHDATLADSTRACVVYMSGYADQQAVERYLLVPLLAWRPEPEKAAWDEERLAERLPAAPGESHRDIGSLAERICAGAPALLLDGANLAFSFELTRDEHRSLEEPMSESVVRGPRDGFSESLGANLPLVRRRLKTPDLKTVGLTVGDYSKTKVVLAYIKGVANPELVNEIRERIGRIRVDGVLESETIEEWISDNPFSLFPQFLSTERPDVVCANLLEGRVAILTDGTPFALLAPVSLFSLLQSPEDYYQNLFIGTFIRWLRYAFFAMSLLLPSAYVAITTFHQEMIPTVLLLNISKSREEIPFPALIEALIMELTFEALREAGVRLPKQVGSAVSIVGALVIGQAATSAGIVSAPMVIVVAITGISSFMIPRYALGIPPRLLRFPIMLLAGTLGLIGVMLGFIVMIIHLCRLRSFGLPYLSPVSPTRPSELKDIFARLPSWKQGRGRPSLSGESASVQTAAGRPQGKGGGGSGDAR